MKVGNRYIDTELNTDIAVITYLGHILLTRIPLGETGKSTLFDALIGLLKKIDSKQKHTTLKIVQTLAALHTGEINRDDIEKQIYKGSEFNAPFQKALYLFFKYFDYEDLADLDSEIRKYYLKEMQPLACMLPYLYHDFLHGYSGFPINRKQLLVEKYPYCLIWPMHILKNIISVYPGDIFNLPASIAIQEPYTIKSKNGILTAFATENSNPFFQIDATYDLIQLEQKAKKLESELLKIRDRIDSLKETVRPLPRINSKIPPPKNADRKLKDKPELQPKSQTGTSQKARKSPAANKSTPGKSASNENPVSSPNTIPQSHEIQKGDSDQGNLFNDLE